MLSTAVINTCLGCNRKCRTLYCDGCAPPMRQHMDTIHEETPRALDARQKSEYEERRRVFSRFWKNED